MGTTIASPCSRFSSCLISSFISSSLMLSCSKSAKGISLPSKSKSLLPSTFARRLIPYGRMSFRMISLRILTHFVFDNNNALRYFTISPPIRAYNLWYKITHWAIERICDKEWFEFFRGINLKRLPWLYKHRHLLIPWWRRYLNRIFFQLFKHQLHLMVSIMTLQTQWQWVSLISMSPLIPPPIMTRM